VLVPLIGTGLYGNWITSHILQENALSDAQNKATQQATRINAFLNSAKQDILFLSEMDGLQSLLNARADNTPLEIEHWRQHVSDDFTTFSRRRGIYYQVRYITETGQEFIRIDSDGVASYPIARANLQNKSGRYYFQETMALKKGDVFVSPLDLNREHGAIETPFKPVLRYATPVFDAYGKARGIVITNIFAEKFLNTIGEADNDGGIIFMVDQDGYYLSHPNHNIEWGGPNDLNTGFRVQTHYPKTYRNILSGRPGYTLGNNALVYIPVFPDPANQTHYWIIIHDELQKSIFAAVWQFRVTAVSILILAGVVAFALTVGLAHNLTASIRTLRENVELFGQGKLTAPVPITTNDEIGQLTQAFNEMSETIARYSHQRQNLLEQLIHFQEEERRMAAYDIHDGLIQRLVGTRLQLNNFTQLRNTDPDKAEASLQRGLDHLKAAIVEGRHLIEGLRPALLDDLGLSPALHELAKQIASDMHCQLDFSTNLADSRLPPLVEITAFRIVQEALNNCLKYSRSPRLRVDLKRTEKQVELTVQDWGVGFKPACMDEDHRCIGLMSMKERAGLLGGECYIDSVPGEGTVIKSILPLE